MNNQSLDLRSYGFFFNPVLKITIFKSLNICVRNESYTELYDKNEILILI